MSMMLPARASMEGALRRVLNQEGLPRPKFAVAAPLVWAETGPELLIEVRAAGISQAGDPCFPGGKIEPGETPAQAAARELQEELDISAEGFLGYLPTVRTYLGSMSDILVCSVSREAAERAAPSPAEVETLLRVPLAFFLREPDAGNFLVGGHTVWGMTAGAIRQLCLAWRRAELLLQ